MNRDTQVVLKLFINFTSKVEILFGISQFAYKSKWAWLISLAIRVFILVLYPISCIRILNFDKGQESVVTKYARNVTFAFNWTLLLFIYANETLKPDEQIEKFTKFKSIISKVINFQTFRENVQLLMRCTFKITLTLSLLLYLSYEKYKFNIRRNLSEWENYLLFVLLLPFVVFSLTSNQIYCCNALILQLLKRHNNNHLKCCAVSYKFAHDNFKDLNRLNALNLIFVIAFCILNIIYQVSTCIDDGRESNICFNFL